jgi:putative transposase
MRPRGDPKTLERRRLKAIRLVTEGISPGRIAAQLGVSRRSFNRWLAAYRSRGIEGVAPLPSPGRQPKLSIDDRARLTHMLLERARSFGYPTDLWTSPRVADLIQRRFRISYHVNHISRLLHSLGFIVQNPKRGGQKRPGPTTRGWVLGNTVKAGRA